MIPRMYAKAGAKISGAEEAAATIFKNLLPSSVSTHTEPAASRINTIYETLYRSNVRISGACWMFIIDAALPVCAFLPRSARAMIGLSNEAAIAINRAAHGLLSASAAMIPVAGSRLIPKNPCFKVFRIS